MLCSKRGWNRNYNFIIPIILLCLTCFGCARKPWTDPLDEKQAENVIQLLETLNSRAKLCSEGIDGEVTLSHKNLINKKAVKGYFQLLSPTFIKFVISNPLGQPVIAITSDQHSFQLINTLEKKYISGSVYSYGLLSDIPPALLKGNWHDWIRGIITIDPAVVHDIRQDRKNRGIWVLVERGKDADYQKIHLLIEPGEGNILSRIIESNTGEVLARITYKNWIPVGNCKLPHIIEVTDLGYNTGLTIRLSDVLVADNLDKKDFRLTAPASYMKQIVP